MANSRTRPSASRIVERVECSLARHVLERGEQTREATVALSGGIDSIVLLDIARALAARLGFRLDAVHVNHGLSREADRWERFCRTHCERRRIPFRAVKVLVGGEGANIEAEARSARYAALSRLGAQVVLLAHNQDDQAETILLQLLRGAGVRGLSSMPVQRELDSSEMLLEGPKGRTPRVLLRPLLGVSRREIERYARARRLRWVEDESNTEDKFARNFLRIHVLPLLERRFPGCRAALARSSMHIAAASQMLEQLAAIDAQRVLDRGGLSVPGLRALGSARAANVLRLFLRSRGLQAPQASHLRECLRQLVASRHDANPQLRLGLFVLHRFKGRIELRPIARVDTRSARIPWSGQSRVMLDCDGELRVRTTRGNGVSCAKLAGGQVTIGWRTGGERMRLSAARPRRTLKNLLQEHGVPPWQRERMPLLFRGDELIWAPGIGVAWDFQARGSERSLAFSWIDPLGSCEAN